MGYSFRLAARVILYASSQRPVVEHWLEREIAQWVHHDGSIRGPIVPRSYHGATSRSLLARITIVSNIFKFLFDVILRPILIRVCIHTYIHTTRNGWQSFIYRRTQHIELRLYGVGHMIKDHSDSEEGNQLQQGCLYMHHTTYRIAHTTPFVIPVVEHWLEREIAQWVHHVGSIRRHHTMGERSYHETTSHVIVPNGTWFSDNTTGPDTVGGAFLLYRTK